MMEVKKPIFIIGTGRSGSTIFHYLFSYHPHTTWLTRYCDLYPDKSHYNRWAMQMLNWPLPLRYVRKLIYPSEAYHFWEHNCPGFSEPFRDLLKEDVTMYKKKALHKVMGAMLTPNRPRLLIKITGWPRLGFLKEVFPDAKFIHLYRDGRAVVNSLLHVDWWLGWQGTEKWGEGPLSPERMAKWEKYHQSFVALAAISWEILLEAQEKAQQLIPPEDILQIRYEDFCVNTTQTLQQAMTFSEMDWTANIEATVRQIPVKSTDYKWKEDLTAEQQWILNDCLHDTLQKYGYV